MNSLISLVIPVCNVEKNLDKCMQSVLAQTYDNFEVIFANDGLTDNSGKMCDEYAEKSNRVRMNIFRKDTLSEYQKYVKNLLGFSIIILVRKCIARL